MRQNDLPFSVGSHHRRIENQPASQLSGESRALHRDAGTVAVALPPLFASEISATLVAQSDGPVMPSTDGLAYALCTLAYEVVLNRRVHDTQQPTPVEIVLLALGVALSLAAMAWWVTPGKFLLPYQNHLK